MQFFTWRFPQWVRIGEMYRFKWKRTDAWEEQFRMNRTVGGFWIVDDFDNPLKGNHLLQSDTGSLIL